MSSRAWVWLAAVTVVVIGFAPAPAPASAAGLGALDAVYGNLPPNGVVASDDPGPVATLADGSALVADEDRLGYTELGPNGAPDPAVGPDGSVSVPNGPKLIDAFADAISTTPDGSVVVAGRANENQLVVARFTSAGALDTSFDAGSAVPGVYINDNAPAQGPLLAASIGTAVAVEPGGFVDVVGTAQVGSPAEPALLVERLSPDGGGVFSATVQAGGQPTTGTAVALGPGGTIYAVGTENAGTANARAVVARLTFSGFPATLHLDPSFGGAGLVTSTLGGSSPQANAVAVGADGSVLVGGTAVGSALAPVAVVARFTALGAPDPSFGSGGVATLQTGALQPTLSAVAALAVEPNGAPLVAGDSYPAGQAPATTSFVAELTTTGALDPQFDATGPRPGVKFLVPVSGYDQSAATGLAVDPQGRLLVARDVSSNASSPPPDAGAVARVLGYAPPSAAFTAPPTIVAGQPVTFDASGSSDAVGAITDYAWDFDGSSAFATDGGAAPRIQHTFASAGHATVSLRVTNPAGQTSTVEQTLAILPSATSSAPAASFTAAALSFAVNVNQFDCCAIDSEPQTVFVTNAGQSPLHITAVKVTTTSGGTHGPAFAISDVCVSTLQSNGTYSSGCQPTKLPADTCANATLAPGTRCYVQVVYQDAGEEPSATGSLEIDSDSPTSPDVVALTGHATTVSSSGGAGQVRCPGVIWANGAAGDSTAGAGPELGGCWTDVSTQQPNYQGDTWAAFGPVTVDGGVTLQPTSPDDQLIVSPVDSDGQWVSAISATPSTARYVVEVPPSYADDANPAKQGGTTATQPLGTVSLGTTPFVCEATAPEFSSPYGGCGSQYLKQQGSPHVFLPSTLDFQGAKPADTVHQLPVSSGTIQLTPCGSDTTAFAMLPALFHGPQSATARSTATLTYGTTGTIGNGCGVVSGGGFGNPGPPNPDTCPGKAVPTPNCGPTIQNTPTPHEGRAVARDDGDASGNCPAGDEDYSDAIGSTLVGAMSFGNAYLCYDPNPDPAAPGDQSDVWTVGGSVNIGPVTIDTGPAPDWGISFSGSGRFLGGGIQGIHCDTCAPLAPAVFLTDLSGHYGVDPTTLAANAGISVAGILKINASAFAVWADPSHPYTYRGCPQSVADSGDSTVDLDCPLKGVAQLQTDTYPRSASHPDGQPITSFAAGASGTVTLTVAGINAPLAHAYAFFIDPGYFEFAGGIDFDALGLELTGGVTGALDTGNGEYDVSGNVQVCVHWPDLGSGRTCIAGLQAVASSAGLGACGDLGPFDGGVTYVYGGSLNFFVGGSFFGATVGESCDSGLGPVTVQVQRGRARAHTAQAGGPVSVQLAGHPPATVIEVHSAGGAPGVTLSGPGGVRQTVASAGPAVRTSQVIIAPQPELDETFIEIAHPTPGRWAVTPLAGSPAITKVTSANIIPPPTIRTTVTGHGATRTLAYTATVQPGREITFAEKAGHVFHVIGRASGASGRLTFTPALGRAGRRQIIAELTLAGAPQRPMVVGSYVAPGPPVAGRPPHLRLTRTAGTLRVGWARAANATAYLVSATLSGGRRIALREPAGARALTVPLVDAATTGTVSVAAIGPMGTSGPAADARLSSAGGVGSVRRLRAARAGKDVVVRWSSVRGAGVYLVRIGVGHTAYAPVVVARPRYVSTRTLPGLSGGATATITVVAYAKTGTASAPARLRYRAHRAG